MATAGENIGEASVVDDTTYGILVGWTHGPSSQGINLRLQTVHSTGELESKSTHSSYVMMTRNQALLLANYLLKATGQQLPPDRGSGITGKLRSLFR